MASEFCRADYPATRTDASTSCCRIAGRSPSPDRRQLRACSPRRRHVTGDGKTLTQQGLDGGLLVWFQDVQLLDLHVSREVSSRPVQRGPAAPALQPSPDQFRWRSLRWPWVGEFGWPSGNSNSQIAMTSAVAGPVSTINHPSPDFNRNRLMWSSAIIRRHRIPGAISVRTPNRGACNG